ncbi:MAG: cobalamin-dependent protein [Candidatus Omnitrophica bacterium]|nr:cobalamin-dependent protein [Candidatus Omnitrophota bacterium]
MNIVLVLPPAEKVSEKKDSPDYQHLGLGYISAMLEKNGYNVKIVDAKLEGMSFNQALKAVNSLRPDVLGITAMTHEINAAARLAGEAKSLLPNIFTAIGGVHLSALPVETLKRYPFFDIGVIGEGEYSFLNIIRVLEKGGHDFSPLKGLVYRRDQEVLLSQPMEEVDDLDLLPYPAWHQFPKATVYSIITSRGCPFSCVFCMQAMGRRVRRRSADNIVGEIDKVLTERTPEFFHFRDETFTLDKAKVYEVCDIITKSGLDRRIRWSATTRVDSIDKDLLLKMKEAGCSHIEFGVESGDQEVLERIKKNITLDQARRAVSLARGLGLHTEAAFILGHPGETLETAYRTIRFAAELDPDIAQLGIMVPYPGTEVGRMARKGEGGYRIISDNWSDYNKQLGNALELDGLNRSDLERLQLAGYLKLFIFNRRFKDFLRFMWNYRREMFSFLRNHFKKEKERKGVKSRLDIFSMARMIFSNSPNL